METPYFKYDEFKDNFLNVYEPAEDSFLLLDALQNDINLIKSSGPSICLEIGSGSGVLITSLAKSLKFGYFVSTDINGFACETTLKCARNNEAAGRIEAVNTDLSSGLEMLDNKVDILLFNPPYVPTDNSEITESLLNRAFAGGKDGRVVIDRFLQKCLTLLTNGGLLYLLLIKENRPEEIVAQLNSKDGFDATIVLARKAKNETQCIVRVKRVY